jgi:glycosyltransferase involved in cell wall biosynthesis
LLNSENVHVITPQGVANYASSYWRSFTLGKEAKKNHLDIFHGLAQELPRDIKKSNVKSLVTIHDMIFLRHPEFYKPIDRWIYYNKVKFAINNADRIVAISQQTKQDLIEEFKINEDRISIIYQSCNEVFYEKRSVREREEVKEKWHLPDQYLLYVGALNANKNILIILEALNTLQSKTDIPLVVVGHGTEYKKKMVNYARENGLYKRLIFASEIGDPTPRELSAFYQMASVFIFPSFYEGFGIPILEARFSGIPVIASNSSCLDEAGGDGSYYFDPGNAEELASQLLTIENTKVNYPSSFRLNMLTKEMNDLYS